MAEMRYGLKLSQDATIDQLRAVWRIADEAGFDHCWCMDHLATLGPRDDGPIFEAWTLLAGMAVATSRTRIGCMVTGNTYRHPALLAKAAVTVDHLSGGRLEFGLGAGWAENEHTMLGLPFGAKGDRADWLEEACQVIQSLWTQPRTSLDGKQYKITEAVAEPKPVQQPYPPIWIGGSGRQRTLRITARYADVWNAAGGSPAEVAETSAVLDQRCEEIGRDPEQIRRSVQMRFAEANDELLERVDAYRAVGVTEIVMILPSQNAAGMGEQVAALLPRLRALG
ncbi:MAG: LLM class F420-dependent oxidoreductase [Nocardiopsaceae bacterium]|jgi:F420-dependent oxidoreductase-like protein|nr:LLM class F420-dependent oxidoreductase [Nocardiopsaceae bacterium]